MTVSRPLMAGLALAALLGLISAPARAEVPVPPGPSWEEYQTRRRTLMDQIKTAEAGSTAMRSALQAGANGSRAPGAAGVVVVLVGGGEPGEDAKFRQENDFQYLTGIDVHDAALILWPETGDEALYLPPRNRNQERWEGSRLGPGTETASAIKYARVEPSTTFLADLFRAISDPRTGSRAPSASVYLMEPEAKGATTRSARFAKFVREGAPSSRLKDLAPRVHEMRKVKSEAETALIRQAIAVTGDAQREVVRLIRPGVPEYRLEAAILGAFVAGGASRAGFPSIVGSGPNSTVLHYSKNNRTIEDGDLVVVDIGGEYLGYTADITRTYPANGRYTARQREVYQLVLNAQTAAANDFKTGVSTIASLTRAATNVLRNSPLRAKDADGTEHTMEHFFIHGLGHHMGLDVHDVGDSSKPLGVGEVFTIEPGLYIPAEGFGVRIEDDYRVTSDGLEKLSREIPVGPDEIERLIAQARGQVPSNAAP